LLRLLLLIMLLRLLRCCYAFAVAFAAYFFVLLSLLLLIVLLLFFLYKQTTASFVAAATAAADVDVFLHLHWLLSLFWSLCMHDMLSFCLLIACPFASFVFRCPSWFPPKPSSFLMVSLDCTFHTACFVFVSCGVCWCVSVRACACLCLSV